MLDELLGADPAVAGAFHALLLSSDWYNDQFSC